jgi:hypothetical protein
MSAFAQLQNLYEEWRRLTRKEGAAIQTSNWTEVSACQTAKQVLQIQIIRCSEEFQSEPAKDATQWSALEKSLRAQVNELIMMETQNGQWLSEVRQAAEAEFAVLTRSEHNLHRVQNTYGSTQSAQWQSFS